MIMLIVVVKCFHILSGIRMIFNPVRNDKILDLSESKALADDIINVTEKKIIL